MHMISKQIDRVMRVVLMYYTFAKISKWRKIALI